MEGEGGGGGVRSPQTGGAKINGVLDGEDDKEVGGQSRVCEEDGCGRG